MATRNKAAGGEGVGSLASTVAGPSNGGVPSVPQNVDLNPALSDKVKGAVKATRALPANSNKPQEYASQTTVAAEGPHTGPMSDASSGSTLSEVNGSAKVGSGKAPNGSNATVASLDRVRADGRGQVLTTNQGVPVSDNQSSLKAGLRGPTLLEDFVLREKITHFDHERIPERVVHARGSAAHGFFECTADVTHLTMAAPFAEIGKRTPVFTRFSTVAGERGSADTARDVRGFAVKFYTDQGNWDLVGNNIPVFFIQDAMKFPDLIHAVKPEPHNAIPQASSAHDTFYDFISMSPESAHMLMWVMSDRALPRSLRMMQGFGVHTFRLVNAEGASVFCKFHWEPTIGTHSLVWDESAKITGADPDFHRRDLWEAIEAGAYPEWQLGVQVFTEEEAEGFDFDVLDPTKLIPEELVPVQIIGRMVLDRNPDNFFAETEQVAFCTAHVVPGIDFSNDPLLQGRIFSYLDTQLSRLGGPNFHEIPINSPIAPVANNQRDGMHRQTINRGRVAYEPNSMAGGCPFQAGAKGFVSFPQPTEGDKVRGKPEKFAEHYAQATMFYKSQSAPEQNHIKAALRFELSRVQLPPIRLRMLALLRNIDEDLAASVAADLGLALPEPLPRADILPVSEYAPSPMLSLLARPGAGGVQTRRVAILVAQGMHGASARAVYQQLLEAGAVPRMVGLRLGSVAVANGDPIEVEISVEAGPGVLYDAVVLPDGDEAIKALRCGQVGEFLMEQYRHCKPILALGQSASLLDDLGIAHVDATDGDGSASVLSVKIGAHDKGVARFIKALAQHRDYARETDPPMV
jgi:catalase